MIAVYVWSPINTPLNIEPWINIAETLNPIANFPSGINAPQEPEGHRWGHAGIGFRDIQTTQGPITAYRAFWPVASDGKYLFESVHGRVVCSYEDDATSEGQPGPQRIVMPNGSLHENRVWQTWERFRTSPPQYGALDTPGTFNCCSSVATSLLDNVTAPQTEVMEFIERQGFIPANPRTLVGWLHAFRVNFGGTHAQGT